MKTFYKNLLFLVAMVCSLLIIWIDRNESNIIFLAHMCMIVIFSIIIYILLTVRIKDNKQKNYDLPIEERVNAFMTLKSYVISDEVFNHSGFCSLISKIYHKGELNTNEKYYLKKYCFENFPKFYNSFHDNGYYFTPGNWKVRRKWCKRHALKHLKLI